MEAAKEAIFWHKGSLRDEDDARTFNWQTHEEKVNFLGKWDRFLFLPSLSVLSHVFGVVDKASSSFSAHGKLGNFIIIIIMILHSMMDNNCSVIECCNNTHQGAPHSGKQTSACASELGDGQSHYLSVSVRLSLPNSFNIQSNECCKCENKLFSWILHFASISVYFN